MMTLIIPNPYLFGTNPAGINSNERSLGLGLRIVYNVLLKISIYKNPSTDSILYKNSPIMRMDCQCLKYNREVLNLTSI